MGGDCERDWLLVGEPSEAYMACVSRGSAWKEENACGADGAVGKNPKVGDWGGAA